MVSKVRTKQNRNVIAFVSIGFLLIIILILWLLSSHKTISIIEDNGRGVFNLYAHWEYGNIIAIIRHNERCDRSENQCLDGQNGITVIGKERAIKLGSNFKKVLPINNAIIYNSPVKRTKQTATFMFGNISKEKAWLRQDCKKNLYNNLFKYKEEKKNLILITHSTCMDVLGESEGKKLIKMDIHSKDTYGITIFIAMDKLKKQAYVLGYLYAKDWNKILNY